MCGHLHQVQARTNADRLQVILHRFGPLPRLDIGREFNVKAIGKASFGQQLPRLGRVEFILRGDIAIAAELRWVARRRRHPRAARHQLFGQGLAVNGVENRLPHLQMRHGIARARASGCIHAKVTHAHGFLLQSLQEGQAVHIGDIVWIHIPDPIHALRQQFSQFGGGIRKIACGDLLDRRPPLGAALVIAIKTFVFDPVRDIHLGKAIRPGADRHAGKTLGPHAFAVGLGPNRRHHRQVIKRCRIRPLHLDAHRIRIKLFRALDPGIIPGR